MDWMTRMNAALEYIEANLDGEVRPAEAGRIAGCSAYHFQRVFSYMAGTTLAEYVRRRRLTLAAFDLQGSNAKVIDVAMKYGYDSPTSFTRAFAGLHGITPSEARADGSSFVAYPPLSFQIIVQGVTAMNYRIETKESFRIVGPRWKTVMKDGQNFKDIPGFWDEFWSNGSFQKVLPLMDTDLKGIMGVCVAGADKQDDGDFDYYIAVASDQPAPEGMFEYTVPAANYAIFESTGPLPDALQNMMRRIMTEWLPTSGYDFNDDAPDIEVYADGDTKSPTYKCWAWVPVVKK